MYEELRGRCLFWLIKSEAIASAVVPVRQNAPLPVSPKATVYMLLMRVCVWIAVLVPASAQSRLQSRRKSFLSEYIVFLKPAFYAGFFFDKAAGVARCRTTVKKLKTSEGACARS